MEPSSASEVQVHVNGELVPASAATVSVRDRGFRYGDAAVETVRAYGGDLFRWDAHADRFDATCRALQLDHGLSRSTLRDRVRETLAANDLADALVRLTVSRGVQSGGLTPDPEVDPTVVVDVEPLPRGGRGGEPAWDGPATLQTAKTRRVPDRAVPSDVRTASAVNAVLARLELRVADADEALVLDVDGDVTGGAASSLFFVRDNALRTPGLDGDVYPSVARGEVLDAAGAEGIPVEEGAYAPEDVRRADEVFLANARWEVRPVGTVDGIEVGGGPVTTLLATVFDARVEAACYGDR